MKNRLLLTTAAFVVVAMPSHSGAAGPVGHTILAQKTIQEITSGALPAPPELKRALADPECRRAFRGGAVAPDISEQVSHYGKTGELARNLVETARFYLERAEKSGSQTEIQRAQKQLAFAYGWLSHCAADLDVHPKVNSFTGDAWAHNDKGQKTIHAAREAQLTAYLTRLYPDAAGPFDVFVPFDFLSGVTGVSEAQLRQGMGVLKAKAAAEQWAKAKVTLSTEQLDAIWGACARASLADSRTFVSDPATMRNWDLDCGGRMSTEEFEALRSLVLELNGNVLPPGWGARYIGWFEALRGLSTAQRRVRLKELLAGANGAAPVLVKPSAAPALQTYTERYPGGQLKTQYTYYLDASQQRRQHGLCRMWRLNGKLSDEVQMVHGKIEGLWRGYYDTGELMFEQTYANGRLNGPATRFHRSGKKEEYGIHENGEKDGVWTLWHENGQKRGEDEYRSGNRIRGKSRRWDESGRELQLVGDW